MVVRRETLGARSAGLVAGSVGTAAGAVVVSLADVTDLLRISHPGPGAGPVPAWEIRNKSGRLGGQTMVICGP